MSTEHDGGSAKVASTLCKCGHPDASHYNLRALHMGYPGRRPCHHLGRYDTRCQCKNYQARATKETRNEH